MHVTEVMVNGPDDVYVEREGRIERAPDGLFEGEESVLHLIERIVGPLGLRVDESSPWADARLPDGSRVHAIVPPLSLRGPALTIRKFSPVPISGDDLVAGAAWGRAMLEFLPRASAGARTSSSAAAPEAARPPARRPVGFIPDDERLITIEDAAELRLAKPHVVSLEARPGQRRRAGQVTVRDLVRNALRMRPDRIIVGEVRGGEALDMLQAMNTGHEGSLSTAHANSARHLLWRLETMAMMSDVDLPAAHIRNQVASAIDLVVHLARLRDGRRVVWEIAASREPIVANRSSPRCSGSALVKASSVRSSVGNGAPSLPRSPIAARTSTTGSSLPGSTLERALVVVLGLAAWLAERGSRPCDAGARCRAGRPPRPRPG